MTAGGDTQAMKAVWTQTVDRVKRDVIAPTLWRALERTIPVAWEENNFVVGLTPGEGQLAGVVNTGEHRGALERTLRTLSGNNNLTLRIIEGVSYSDWEYTKARDAAAVAQRTQVTQRKQAEAGTFSSWDEIYEQVSRLWANSDNRSLASGRGRYIHKALDMVEIAMDAMYPTDAKADEQTERALSRLLERIGSNSQADPTFVAYLLFERRKNGAAQ